jgi:hypothetical protein
MFMAREKLRQFPLPEGYAEQQRNAIRKRFHMDDQQPIPLPFRKALVCLQCKHIKNFFSIYQSKSIVHGFGYHRVLVDDADMCLYCARQTHHKPKSTAATGQPVSIIDSINNIAQERKDYKSTQRAHKNDLCSSTTLLEMDIIGTISQVFDKVLFVCPGCGMLTTLSHSGHTDRLLCHQCLKRSS